MESDHSTHKSLLVTGGAGFIGSCLVRMLVDAGNSQVTVLDKLTYAGNLDSLASCLDSPRFTFVQGDICDKELVRSLLQEHRVTGVLHLAAESHVDRSIDGPEEFIQTNVVGTLRMLEAARAYWASLPQQDKSRFRFLHVSTDEVFGSLGPTGYFHEGSNYQPNSPYAASKASADHIVRSYFHTYGFPAVTTNCSNNYGPNQFPEKLIPLMLLNALEGKPLPVYGDGSNVRDWLHVEDHCRALLCVLERGRLGEVYCVGGNSERTNMQVIEAICENVEDLRPGLPHSPIRGLVTFVRDRPGHDRRYAIDSAKLQEQLGWQPQYDFESGIRQTIEWYLANPAWVTAVTTGKYRRERLGLEGLGSKK